MTKKTRFPRLPTPAGELSQIERILWITYNKIWQSKSYSQNARGFDVYKKNPDAKRCFIILADTLHKEHIDPSLYLKVMSKYGKYEHSHWMPHPSWLMKLETLKTFDWVLEKQKARYPRHEDWIRHLNDPGRENYRHIDAGIKDSWRQVHEMMKLHDIGIAAASVLLIDSLSPWFLATCVPFMRAGGVELLTPDDQRRMKKCIRHLIVDSQSRREAWDSYKKGESHGK
jgi:hypothetical protein